MIICYLFSEREYMSSPVRLSVCRL